MTRPSAAVSDEMLAAQIDQLRDQKASWTPVEEKPKEGDLVTVHLAVTSADAPSEGKEYRLVLGGGQVIPAIEELVMALAPGGSVERPVTWPEDFPDEAQRGKTKTVQVQLRDVKRKSVPALDDALALRARLDAGARVVVIGAGFIGAEVAATCRARGLDVTVLEAQEQPMIRGLGPDLGAAVAELHRDHGVDLRTGVVIDAVEGDTSGVRGVRLGDGSLVPADAVVVGIGARPCTDWLEGSGLVIDDGVVCDETSLAAPGVVAAGDIARWPNPLFDGESMRLEHWTNAVEQGVHVARRLLGRAEPFAPVPFVWSDQYDRKIQTVGRVSADDEVHIVHGTVAERRFVALFGRAGRLVGALGFNRAPQVVRYRAMIAERASLADALAHAAR